VVLIVGVNGSGKTTSIGKLSRRLSGEGLRVMLAAGDTFRAAAVEQLETWAQRTGAAFSAQQNGADPGAVMFDAVKAAQSQGMDVLLADTAGRLHSQSHLMEELKKVRRVIQRVIPDAPHEVLLGSTCSGAERAGTGRIVHAAGVTGLVLTNSDGAARAASWWRYPQLDPIHASIGLVSKRDLQPFDARSFAAALMG
jgi:fused signal recognition particle receptor